MSPSKEYGGENPAPLLYLFIVLMLDVALMKSCLAALNYGNFYEIYYEDFCLLVRCL